MQLGWCLAKERGKGKLHDRPVTENHTQSRSKQYKPTNDINPVPITISSFHIFVLIRRPSKGCTTSLQALLTEKRAEFCESRKWICNPVEQHLDSLLHSLEMRCYEKHCNNNSERK